MSTDEWPTVLSKWVTLIRQRIAEAGAPSEKTYKRDGAFSHHAETHAAGLGFGLGLAASSGVLGDDAEAYIGALVAAAFGLNRGPQLTSKKIALDVEEEPHYFIAALGLGLLFGFTPDQIVHQVWSALPL